MIIPALILALFSAPASSKELGYWVNGSATTYDDGWCESQNWKGKCVRRDRDFEVPTPDGKGVGTVKYVQKTKSADTPAKWGLADRFGEIIIDPEDGEGMALTTRTMLLCHYKYKGCTIFSADGKKTKLNFSARLPLLGGVPIVMIQQRDEAGVWGLAPLHRDGTLGRVLTAAKIEEAAANGDYGVFQVHGSSGVISSVIIDVLGHELWAGPELRVYGVHNAHNATGNGYPEVEQRSTLMVVGPAPMRALEEDANLYRPFDGLVPAEMPAGVLGLIPARIIERNGRGDTYEAQQPDEVLCWIVAAQEGQKKRFYLNDCASDTSPLVALKQYPNLEEIDDVAVIPKDIDGKDWKPGVLAVHRVKQKDWMGVTSKTGPRGYGATPEAAYDDWVRAAADVVSKKIAQEQAEAKYDAERRSSANAERAARDIAALARQKEAWAKYIPEFGSKCDGWTHCIPVEDAAFGLGEPHLTNFLSHQDNLQRETELRLKQACAVSQSACREVRRLGAIMDANMEALREQRWRQENSWKGYTQQRIQEIRAGSTVNVPYYEGGRLKFKTISSDEYKRLYGD